MLLSKLRTLEGSQVLMWIVILELIMNVKNLKIINTIEVTTNELEPASKLFKTAEGPLRTCSRNELMVINRETRKKKEDKEF